MPRGLPVTCPADAPGTLSRQCWLLRPLKKTAFDRRFWDWTLVVLIIAMGIADLEVHERFGVGDVGSRVDSPNAFAPPSRDVSGMLLHLAYGNAWA